MTSTLGTFTIKDIEAVTGIKGPTLRMWEQRYGIINPKRSETNIRYYDDSDLKQLLNISVLNNHGFKISEIAKMSEEEIAENVIRLSSFSSEHSNQIKALISAMLGFNEAEFHKLLSAAIMQHGLEYTLLKIVFPFLNEVGILWQVGSIQPSHEHFVTNLVKQKLFVAIDGMIGRSAAGSKRFLLFLPENEKHSLGLLFANYLIRSRGHEVVYLGQEVPLKDLKFAFSEHQPDFILTLMTSSQPDLNKQDFVDFLSRNWPSSQILLTGSQFLMCDLELRKNITLIKNLDAFISLLDNIREAPLRAGLRI
ncbi:MAG: MerR family transcriptional regulator [Bacteroidetes bacterium]|nr:MerR family transcriptional regulator [Bacteroidota bacterium]MCK6610483.1 MerR family transcriptional regulator [Bacteroidia bacterium]